MPDSRDNPVAAPVLVWLCAALAVPAQAWGPQGHRVAGTVAENNLSPVAREAVVAILGDESLAMASTWADRMRADPAPFWQHTAGAYHYVNPSPGIDYRPGDAPRRGDAYSALAAFARDLASDSASLAQRQLALRFSIHIVQDLHQPLHAGERDDRGGNDVEVSFDGRQSNLHRVWDSGLLAAASRSDREWVRHLDETFPGEQRADWQQADPLVWIRESSALSREVYPHSAVIGEAYIERHRETVERRLAQAGVRTAVYLDRLFTRGIEVPPAPPVPAATPWQRLKDFLQEIVQ